LVWLVGLVDDVRGLHPGLRIVAQLVAAALVWQSGWRPAFLSGGAGFAAIALIVVLFVNAFNFLDGADGLCAGVACIAALAYLALPQHALPFIVAVLAACTAAASAAFLVFNAPRASIFMGDSGSTTLGFLFALMALEPTYVAGSSRRLVLFPFVILGVPLLDALRIVAARVMRRQSPLFGDREHAYDLFFARGWKPWPVVLVFWLLTAVCGFAGIFLVRGNSYAAVVAAIAWLVISLAILASARKAGREPHTIAQDPEPSPCKTEFS
jgi:UDP-GlcNAc:undecaprenyl-phosphate GlcNAc-1-phosphate transferase